MKKRILISLGGNALGTLYDELIETVGIIAKPIADLIAEGNEVVICHGNGPQVGFIKTHIDKGVMAEDEEHGTTLPLSECVDDCIRRHPRVRPQSILMEVLK